MEARVLILLAAVLLIRIPFLDHPIQGDDVYYLAVAENARLDPRHPMHLGVTFQGARLSMTGHPHPPLNGYILALLLGVFGGVREVWFHAVYLMFSLAAVWAMYRLSRRFTEHPLLATALFAAVPAFVVNGNSLEADLPFLAFWMLGFAMYFDGRHRLAAGALALAALGAYQSIFAVPILAHHAWFHRRRSKTAWLAVAAPLVALGTWQLFQLVTSGEMPAGVLAGYLRSYGLLALVKKLDSGLALVAHLGWIVFLGGVGIPACRRSLIRWLWTLAPAAGVALVLPGYQPWQRGLLAVSLAAGLSVLWRWAMALGRDRSGDDGFGAAWGLVFFTGAAVAFFAGSARYLLPVAAPVIWMVVRSCRTPWLLWPAVLANLALGLMLAAANYQYWREYRRFADELAPLAAQRRMWSNAEWGLRYYLGQLGGEPLERGQAVPAGAMVVTSRLAGAIPYTAGGQPREILRRELRTHSPLRLFGLNTRSGYSSSDLGVLPFDLNRGVIDEVKAQIIGLPDPRESFLRLGDPQSGDQILSGFYPIEDNAWRWMGEQGVVILKVPQAAARFEMTFAIPEAAPARRVTVAVDGISIANQPYPGPGRYVLSAPVTPPGRPAVEVTIAVDQAFQPPGADRRRLGMIVQELGLR